MATQVSTSHTVNTRAPLKVPRRVPMNHVTLGIQKFLPYAVVFLLSLMLYSALHPSKQTAYPPYSPPNMGEEPYTDTYGELGGFARTVMNKRAELLEDALRKSETNSRRKTGEWREWSNQQASTLRQKLEQAKGQEERTAEKAKEVIAEMKEKTGETLKTVQADIKESVMDVADWWKAYGEELMENANKVGSEKLAETQQFAYDAMYAWKQKSASMKEAAKDKLEDVKEVTKDKLEDVKSAGEDFIEASKLKVEEVVEKASEGLQDISHDTFRTAQRVVEKVADAVSMDSLNAAQEKLGNVKDAASDMLSEASQKIQDVVGGVKEGLSQTGLPQLSPPLRSDSTMSNRVGSLIERVKSGLVEDEEVRRALSMKDEWAHVDFEQKVESIVQQICLLGSDVADEVLRKLEQQRCA